jgi:hypothetical protein
MTLAQLEAAVSLDGPTARSGVLAMLWSDRWSVDLDRPLFASQRAAGGVMSASGFELRVGGRVWLDGQGWEVAELVCRGRRPITLPRR